MMKRTRIYKLLLLTVWVSSLILLVVTGCKKEEEENDLPPQIGNYSLNVFPDRIYVGESGSGKIQLSVNSPTELDWEVKNLPFWLSFEQESGTISGSSTEEISFKILDETGLPNDYITEYIEFTSANARPAKVDFLLNLESYFDPLEFSGFPLDIPLDYSTVEFSVYNDGYNYIYWYFKDIPEHLNVNYHSGYFVYDSTTKIEIIVDKSYFESSGKYTDTLHMYTSIGDHFKIKVQTDVYVDGSMWKLPFDIVDAAYAYTVDKIIAVVNNPNSMVFIDPEDNTYSTVSLVKEPTCISVNDDTDYAIIGHDAFITLYNMNSNEIENIFEVSGKVFDIVHSSNGFAYFTTDDSYDFIKCLEIETGNEFDGNCNGSLSGKLLTMHPNGQSIYYRRPSGFANSIGKFDIQNDTANFLYGNNLYDVNLGDNFWMGKQGERIYSGSTVLTTSSNPDLDLLYSGTISEETTMRAFDDAPGINRFCGIFSEYVAFDPDIYTFEVYSLDYLNQLGSLNLPPFFTETTQEVYISEGRFLFIDSSNSFAWVIIQAEEDYPDEDNWAIIQFDIQNY